MRTLVAVIRVTGLLTGVSVSLVVSDSRRPKSSDVLNVGQKGVAGGGTWKGEVNSSHEGGPSSSLPRVSLPVPDGRSTCRTKEYKGYLPRGLIIDLPSPHKIRI